MKTVLIVEHGDRNAEEAVKFLLDHGYIVESAKPCTAPPNEPGPESVFPMTAVPAGKTEIGKASPETGWPDLSDIHTSPCPIMIARASDGVILDCNQPVAELTGYGREEMIGQNMLNLFLFLEPELWSKVFRKLEAEGEIRDIKSRMWTKNGLVAFVQVSLRGEETDGIPCHIITVRHRTPGATMKTESGPSRFVNAGLGSIPASEVNFSREQIGRLIDVQDLQDLMNSFYKVTHIGMAITDVQGNVQVATGWQDVCTRFHRIHSETLKNCLESDIHLSRKLGQGGAIYKCKNGMWDMATPLIIGGRHIANIFLGQFFFEGEVPDYEFFRKQAETYGFDAEEYLAAVDNVPRWTPELVQNVMEFYKKLAVMISRLSIGNIQLSQALDEQERVSEELRRAKLVLENSPVVLFRWRAEEGWPVEFVSNNVNRFGYTPEELLSGIIPFSSIVYPEDLERVAAEVEKFTRTGTGSFQQEYRIVTRDGAVRWVDDRTVIERDANEKVTHYQGILMDITERRLAEEAIHQSEEKFRTLFMSLGEGFYLSEPIFDDNGTPCDYRYLEVNPNFEQIVGIGRDQIIGKRYKELVLFDTTRWLENYCKVVLTGEPCTYDFYSKEYGKYFETYAYKTAKGQISVIVIDVTERKWAEKVLRESEQKFRVLAETLPTAIILHQGEKIIYANPATNLMTGYNQAELMEMNFWEWCMEEDRDMVRERGMSRLRGEAGPSQYEFRLMTKNGIEKWVMVSAGFIEYRGKQTVIATLLDITETKRAEERIQAALAEKIILLKEVHHRVKNNLQIISSLLDLQSDSISDEQTRCYFRECQNRVRSMALVHEQIYKSKDLSSIDFGDYIRDLSQCLFDSYTVGADRISLSVNGPEVVLGINEAIPCGLIVNELVSNALKHAFPAYGSGDISIDFNVLENDRISLVVADTGVGLPDGFDFRNTHSLGLQLVNMLVRQLRGRLSVDVEQGGTTVSITFPVTT